MEREPEFAQVGQRIRSLRRARGLTLGQLGERTGLSTSYISQIENARTNLHLRILRDIAQALDVPLVDFLYDGAPPDVSLVRTHERRTYTLASGAIESLLFSFKRYSLEATIMELPPGTNTGAPNSHPGEEFTYVLRGRVRIWIGETRSFDLDEGDIIYYRSALPHRWENPFAGPAQFMINGTPATF